MSRRRWITLYLAFLMGGFVPLWVVAAPQAEQAEKTTDNQAITGAGAHFSWLVFEGQRKSLEQHVGRPIKLYGKESMLGAGCNAGIKMARQQSPGHDTFGFVCCEITAKEAADKGIKVYPVANEPILILVNKDNPVDNLSLKQVRNIFRGRIRSWKQVGGRDEPIVVVMRPHCKSRPGHWKTILPKYEMFRKDKISVRSAADMVSRVTDFSGAIGHTGSAWAFGPNDRVKALRINGRAPTAKNLGTGKYPFFRTLSAVAHPEAPSAVRDLIEQARRSAEFRKIASKYELVPVAKGR